MKNALILHSTNGNHNSLWFPWLKLELEKIGWKVWLPDLPQANRPTIANYTKYLLSQAWQFNQDSIIIGHSSGAVEIFGLLEQLQLANNIPLKACFLVAAFKGNLGRAELNGMVATFDFQSIKLKSDRFIFIHSDNDPHCPLKDAHDLASKVNGKLIIIPNQGHFISLPNLKYDKFPSLIDIINRELA